MSGDPEQKYFSDGITDEIITQLSRFKRLCVVARNSTFQFKGRSVDVRQAGDRVRNIAQLIDPLTGHHLWVDSYDRNLKDIFALQDEIALNTLKALEVE
jgi:adenylate cyclase